ncbi:3-hydroxyacyl-CoA dehydrogenase/enoyl-CoA hydratase family protein [Azohydromonas lata]|uniref:3-hydroxyacyl-CoA dehydrogenase/enoyl-CoA hydratase family protein n=1 Tax=Azohydromonas lata TaxID=45677 RepID=UPI000829CE3B|nr:3-hydroxyacyl-CoA dehydrogenase/enoyl-CoA hydratase family protein [Azohydromonas lata]
MRFQVRKAAVLGAGVMGAQIAAHFINVRVPVVLFDLPAKEGPKNGIAVKAVENLKKLKPAPLGLAEEAALIRAANYEDDLALLAECDLVIEAIAERMDWKQDLYAKIAPHVAPHAILASNTSGLSITQLAQGLPDSVQERFCGIHFFNPPRYMQLVELIPAPRTAPGILDQLETFVTTGLGKGVVRAKDTPNFIANRVGVMNMLATMVEAERFKLGYDVVDDLTGKKLGRASSGTFRTADVVGLDTLAHVVRTMQEQLPNDPFNPHFATPPVLAGLIAQGALGQKAGAGFYKKVGKDILHLDPEKRDYVPSGAKADEIIGRMLKKPAPERLKLLREASNPQAQFLWAILRDGFHYAAVHLHDIAESARDVDLALRWGFGMAQGPFELWQAAGWTQVAQWIREDIAAGKTLSSAPLPAWVFEGPVAERGGVHVPEGSWSASQGRFVPKHALPVYERQLFPESVAGLGANALQSGTELFRNEELRAWTLDGEVLIASITSKMHLISPTVTEGLMKAVELAEERFKGLVVWSPDDMFSAGANLEALMPVFMAKGPAGIDPEEKKLQQLMLRVRYAQVPVVAALRGIALGGGCELIVHCARRVAAMESYVGLVEVGVGLIPGAGGLTYIARRAAEKGAAAPNTDLLPFLKEGFTAAAMATVGTGALDSRRLGYLLESDLVVPHKDELLYVALNEVRALAACGYRPPLRRSFPVAGRSGIATIETQLVGMRDGGFISAHDFRIARMIADVVCGGDVDAGTLVTEDYLMALERKHFCTLLAHPKTQERIMGLLQTGKPVRN